MILTMRNYICLDYRVPRQYMQQVTSDVHLPKKKAPLTKWASVDDIATYVYSVDVPDGEV